MAVKLYNIIISNGKGFMRKECSEYSLEKILQKFIKSDNQALIITIHPKSIKKKQSVDKNKVEKQRYYNNKYSTYSKKYKNGKINEKEFAQIKIILKQLKKECETRAEFEEKLLKNLNKKNTNNTSEYNVSE